LEWGLDVEGRSWWSDGKWVRIARAMEGVLRGAARYDVMAAVRLRRLKRNVLRRSSVKVTI